MNAWGLLILGIFLLIGFLWRKREKGTWLSWNIFLQSIWLGGLASLVLWIGISGSIFSIENLFFDGASFSRIYEYLAAVCFIFVNGTFILNYYNYSLEETIPKDEKTSQGFKELGENIPTCSDFLSFVSWLDWLCSLANFHRYYAF